MPDANFNPDQSQDNDFVPWQMSFKTQDRATVEQHLRRLGGYSWDWTENGGLVRSRVAPPARPHHATGEMCWFNQLTASHGSYFHAHPSFPELLSNEPETLTFESNPAGEMYPFHTRYGDGSEIPRATVTYLRDLVWQQAVGFRWQEGDLLVIDNYAVMHGRLGYSDTPEARRKMCARARPMRSCRCDCLGCRLTAGARCGVGSACMQVHRVDGRHGGLVAAAARQCARPRRGGAAGVGREPVRGTGAEAPAARVRGAKTCELPRYDLQRAARLGL